MWGPVESVSTSRASWSPSFYGRVHLWETVQAKDRQDVPWLWDPSEKVVLRVVDRNLASFTGEATCTSISLTNVTGSLRILKKNKSWASCLLQEKTKAEDVRAVSIASLSPKDLHTEENAGERRDGPSGNETDLRRMLRERQDRVGSSSPTKKSLARTRLRNEDERWGKDGKISREQGEDTGVNMSNIDAEDDPSMKIRVEKARSFYEDQLALRKALKIRRSDTEKTLQEAFQAVKLSTGYSKEVVANMPEFVDQLMVEAVALKTESKYVTSSFVARARACIDRSKVVHIVKWMKHNNVTIPRVGKLVCMTSPHLDKLQQRITWLKKIYVRGRDLGVVLTRQGCILERPLKDLDEIVNSLEGAGLRREWLGFVVSRSPGVLSLSSQELHGKLAFFNELGLTPEQFGVMTFNFPASIGHFSINEMQTKVDYMKLLGLHELTIGKAIARRPQLLACSVDEAWRPLVKYFQCLGIQRPGIQRIMAVHPAVFCLNLEFNIAPKVRFLRAIGVHEEVIGQVLVDFPPLLSYSLDKKIRPVVRLLLEKAGVAEENVGKVIGLQPELIGCSLSNKLEPIIEYLLNQKLSRSQLGAMVTDFPMLLKYNIPVIQPKFKYFKRVMARPFEDLVVFPRYFSYSLQGRIVPRHQIVNSKGLNFSLRYMLACSDDLFDQRVVAALAAPDFQMEETEEDGTAYTNAEMEDIRDVNDETEYDETEEDGNAYPTDAEEMEQMEDISESDVFDRLEQL